MLALTDAQFARLFIAATAVAWEDRCRWLQNIARRIDPPPQRVLRDLPKAKGGDQVFACSDSEQAGGIDRRLAVRARKAKHRARQRKGERVFKLTANYELIVGGLIGSGRISERAALDHGNVERVLSRMLMEWGKHWSR